MLVIISPKRRKLTLLGSICDLDIPSQQPTAAKNIPKLFESQRFQELNPQHTCSIRQLRANFVGLHWRSISPDAKSNKGYECLLFRFIVRPSLVGRRLYEYINCYCLRPWYKNVDQYSRNNVKKETSFLKLMHQISSFQTKSFSSCLLNHKDWDCR